MKIWIPDLGTKIRSPRFQSKDEELRIWEQNLGAQGLGRRIRSKNSEPKFGRKNEKPKI